MSKITINIDETFTHLPSAPIVEAVIDIRAQCDVVMTDEMVRGLANTKLAGYSYANSVHEFSHEVKLEAEKPPEQSTKKLGWKGASFHSSDHKNIVQFNRDGFVYSRLSPYQNWDAFLEEGLRLWEVYSEIAQPIEINRVGVRFVNRITMPPGEVSFENYLSAPPKPPLGLELPFYGFMHQETLAVPGYPYAVNFIRTIQQSSESGIDTFGLILDIDVATIPGFEFDKSRLVNTLNEMRWLKNKVFFGSITETAMEACQ